MGLELGETLPDSKTNKEIIKISDLLAKEPKELQSFLESLNEDQLNQIVSELELEGDQLEAVEKKILSAVKELQKEIVELLPDYPVSKKIAVIINGDTQEERHTGNVDRAIKALEKKGFEEIYVIGGTHEVNDKYNNYDGSLAGIDTLFSDLEKSLQKDSLVFFYGTGHGAEDSSMVIGKDHEKFTKEAMIEKFAMIGDKGGRGIFVFDTCYSGSLPDAIIRSGIEGLALSPAPEGETAMCQFFAPEFFQGLEEGRDLDESGETTLQEVFRSALDLYNDKLDTENTGEYRQTIPQLSLNNVDKLFQSDKPVLIEIDATWCGPCKDMAKEISKVEGVLGSRIDIYKITNDLGEKNKKISEKAKDLYRALKIENPNSFPRLLLIHNGEIEEVSTSVMSADKMFEMLKNKTGVAANYDHYFKAAVKYERYKEEEINNLIKRFGPKNTFSLIAEDLQYADIIEYDKRFNAKDIINLIQFEVSNETAMQYSDQLSGLMIAYAISEKISIKDEDLSQYNDRFDADGKAFLMIHKCPNNIAMQYDKKFNGQQISYLRFGSPPLDGVGPEAANEYDATRFKTYEIVVLHSCKIRGAVANTYDKRFNVEDIKTFVNAYGSLNKNKGYILNDEAIKYDPRFTSSDIKHFMSKDIEYDRKNLTKFNERFRAEDIHKFYKNDISYEIANLYYDKFSSANILTFIKADISPTKTQPYIELLKENKNFHFDIDYIVEANLDPNKLLAFMKSNFSVMPGYKNYYFYKDAENKEPIHLSYIPYIFQYNIDCKKISKEDGHENKIPMKTKLNLIRANISFKEAREIIENNQLDYNDGDRSFRGEIDNLILDILSFHQNFNSSNNGSPISFEGTREDIWENKVLLMERLDKVSPINKKAIIQNKKLGSLSSLPSLVDELKEEAEGGETESLFDKIKIGEEDWLIEQEEKDSSEFKLTIYQDKDKKNYHTFSVRYDKNYELNITFHTKCTESTCLSIDDIDTAPKFKSIKEFKKFIKEKSAT